MKELKKGDRVKVVGAIRNMNGNWSLTDGLLAEYLYSVLLDTNLVRIKFEGCEYECHRRQLIPFKKQNKIWVRGPIKEGELHAVLTIPPLDTWKGFIEYVEVRKK